MTALPEQESHPPALICWIAGQNTAEHFPSLLRYLQVGLVDQSFATLLLLTGAEPASLLDAGLCTVLREPKWPWPLGRLARRRWMVEFQEEFEDLRRGVPSVVHCLDTGEVRLATDLAEATGSELVLTWNRLESPPSSVLASRERMPVILCPSTLIRDAILRAGGDERRVRVIPVGVASEQPAGLPRREDSATTVACASSMDDDGGGDLLLRAAKLIHPRAPTAMFFFMGRGPEEPALRQTAESLGIDAHVIFTGRLANWREALAEADIFCVPGARAPWREEPLHALAAGVAVVAVEGAPYDEFIADRTAMIIPPEDEAIMAEAILSLIEDPARATNLGGAAATHIRTNNSLSRMVADHLRIYGELAGQQKTIAFPKSA